MSQNLLQIYLTMRVYFSLSLSVSFPLSLSPSLSLSLSLSLALFLAVAVSLIHWFVQVTQMHFHELSEFTLYGKDDTQQQQRKSKIQ